MKNIFIILLFTLACFQKANAQLSNAGLVVYLPLNGNALDISGNGYNGLLNGAVPTTDAAGTPNGAMYFDLNSKITIVNPALLRGPQEEFTILAKVYFDSLPFKASVLAGADFFSWRYKSNVGSNAYYLNHLTLTAFSGENLFPPPLHPVWGIRTFNFESACSSQISLHGGERDSARIVGQWFTYAFVFKRGIASQYFNCKKITEYPTAFSALRPCERDSGNEMNIYLGNNQAPTPGNFYGMSSLKLDELRIYKRALDEDEIKAYADGFCKPEIVPFIGVKKRGCSNTEFTISDESVTYGIPVINRKWRITRDNFTLMGVGSFDYTCTRTGNYTVYLDITDIDGYHYLKDTSIFVNAGPKEHFIKTPQDIYYLCGEQKSVKVNLTGGLNYQWSPCIGLSSCTDSTVTITPQSDQQYQVIGSKIDGCLDTIYITVKKSNDSAEVFVPSAFTPNNDGVNDVLGIQSVSPPGSFQFEIYNRWGERVFKTGYALATWNGTFNYKKQPAGIYLWKLRYSGGPNCPETRKKGTVMLIR